MNTSALLNRQTLGDLLRRSAARAPKRPAILCGTIRWTYAEFDRLCTVLAAGLAARGIGHGDRIAILARNSHAFAAIRFATARLGAVLVPVNFMLKEAEARYIIGHSGARMICADSELLALAEASSLGTAITDLVWLPDEAGSSPPPGILTFDRLIDEGSGRQAPDPALDGRDLLQLIYTSGTESLPKGVMLTHEAVISQYVSVLADSEIAEDDIMLHCMPLFHCAQLDAALGPAIYRGAQSLITTSPAPARLLALIERFRVTWMFLAPTAWIALLRSPDFDRTDLSSLVKGFYGASIMPLEILHELRRRLPHLRLWNIYGQTEIAPVASILRPGEHAQKAGSCGRPMLNVETRLVDDDGNDVPPGTIGEVVHRSPQLMTGYYNDPERTAAAFRDGWFHSGDLGLRDEDGYLTIVDRKKDMITTGGENVASREVEDMIYRDERVEEVAVIGLPHPTWIEAVTAVVVPRAGHILSEAEIVAHCARSLAGFKVPKRVLFAESLPKNPSGKLMKRDLRLTHQALYQTG